MSPLLSVFRPQSLKLLGHLSVSCAENSWGMPGLREGPCSGSEGAGALAQGGPGRSATPGMPEGF